MTAENPSIDEKVLQILRENLADVSRRIQAACTRAGRTPEGVQLVAVTKYANWSWVQQLAKLHQHFGENRPQQLVDRQQQLPQIHWHLIGQLQRNKVRSVLPHCGLIHSVDSEKLFHKLADVGKESTTRPQVLLQLNISEEASKSGFRASEFRAAWPNLMTRSGDIDVRGFMTMAPANQDPDQARATFRGLREVRDSWEEDGKSVPDNWSLKELSMGMSGDFEGAIEEGATIVRIGSALYQGLEEFA